MLLSVESQDPREELFWPLRGIKTTLEVETTLSRCRNYPLPKGTEMTPRSQNYSFEFAAKFVLISYMEMTFQIASTTQNFFTG